MSYEKRLIEGKFPCDVVGWMEYPKPYRAW